jgi:ribosomal protein L40E
MNSETLRSGFSLRAGQRSERASRSWRQAYLVFHHVGFYFYIIARSGFFESFCSETPYFFFFLMLLFCLSLDVYAVACGPPGMPTGERANTEHLWFCKSCNLHCPIRAGHCRTCGHCVLRRDHHCPWTGGCIGRDNHLAFVGFLIIEFVMMLIVLFDMLVHLLRPAPPLLWIRNNFGFLVIMAVCWFDVSMVGGLFLTHARHVMLNQTVWEVERRDRISYLRECGWFQRPFDRGCLNNIVEFITMKARKKEWGYPSPPTIDDLVEENAFGSLDFAVSPADVMAIASARNSVELVG